MRPKKGNGRRKIKMEKLENESNLYVAFAKRRPTLFQKASELSILCGAEIAIIVFSPTGKLYSFGHPSVEMIGDRFLTQTSQPSSSHSQLVEAYRNTNIYELSRQLTYVLTQLEVEKKKSEELTNISKQGIGNHPWEAPIENLGLQELEQLKLAMEWLKNEIEEQKKRIVAANQLPIVPVSRANGTEGGYTQLLNSVITMTHGFNMGNGHVNR
ncbi:putative transcription factor MADS-type1 family [Helianthus annuus]|nr:putative transcription factor MADS-type1 family [Helianthus annuus]